MEQGPGATKRRQGTWEKQLPGASCLTPPRPAVRSGNTARPAGEERRASRGAGGGRGARAEATGEERDPRRSGKAVIGPSRAPEGVRQAQPADIGAALAAAPRALQLQGKFELPVNGEWAGLVSSTLSHLKKRALGSEKNTHR